MAPVRIVAVSYVAAPADAVPPPEPIKLNAMEAQWVVAPVLQHLLLFEGDQLPPFDAVVQSLRSSLASTLTSYAPLAGKLHYLADTGEVAICCRTAGDDGVRFVVAETDADARSLAGDADHDVLTFEQLVPEVDMALLPAPVLAVQATRLGGGGGVALGFTLHHGVADGRSLWKFVEAWAAVCRGDTPPAPPVFDRSRVKMPGGEELARSVLRKYAPDLPVVTVPDVWHQDRLRFTRRTFNLDAPRIARLKQAIARLAEAQGGAPLRRPPSTFAAVIALAWASAVRGRSIPAEDEVFLFFLADVRDRLDPPAGADYFGACLAGCIARVPARELHGEGALAAAAAAIQDAVGKMVEDPLGCWPGWEFLKLAAASGLTVPADRFMNVSGSAGFRVYEVADFGWGKPRRTENVRMNLDGQVALVRARDGAGVQASVSMLRREHVDEFESEMLKLLG
ncbi:hypothetical protein SETIT_7G256200v2 [Setaria italica]|uniref:Uncharacterized protein n=1 Tax=Setaria italica TaxID=4555 RepID=K3Y783_SETIT|nr:anthocyanin 5-aromatic acyltransferase [Setaria italica]XP_004976977.1 anthocyanin 5-aromatic acyltransferase [Setaria italica]XP_004976978.1 anthocyanin 5-aromatic acyltransferase [Setaria italica]XP_004976980.1 anthocyanin 5-aromatic acyltransferase [Setaria italica]XP_022683955.1 anthocyanin 5-aromatic acyltransferase [Setaria italica]RCV35645.1 hypothetical protein SETIT_7G256200v2 [Setaria italica]RCV35646.1 hypothetical protein SETIT_7G256200v2 [Setaria italica]